MNIWQKVIWFLTCIIGLESYETLFLSPTEQTVGSLRVLQ